MLEVECHQRFQWLSVRGRKAVEGLLDGGSKFSERRMVATVERTAFDELPQAFDQVQVRGVRRQEQERDPQLFREVRPWDWTTLRPFLWYGELRRSLLEPLLLELGRGQVAQRRVNPLAIVHVVQEPAQLPVGIAEVLVF